MHGILTRLLVGQQRNWSSITDRGKKIVFFRSSSRPALGFMQLPIKNLSGNVSLLFWDVKQGILVVSDVPRNFVRGGVQQIQLRTEDRENGDLGAAAP